MKAFGIALLCAATACVAFADQGNNHGKPSDFPSPLVIGHRGGATGFLPDHTLENYALGIELGADFVEPDLVATKDGVLIARHEPNLIDTTNVKDHPEFAGRRRTVTLDGVPTDGFWASDFTLAEIKKLRAVQPLPDRDPRFNGKFQIPTFDEIIAFVKRKTADKGRPIGIYPETKHPTYHQSIGLPLEDRLVDALKRAGWNKKGAPVIIQSFETTNLKYLRTRTPVTLVQLVDADDVGPDGKVTYAPPFDRPYDWTVQGRAGTFGDLLTPAGLDEVNTYADGVGPWKPYLISYTSTGARITSTVIADAHRRGLLVHPYTFRNDPGRLPAVYGGHPEREYLEFYIAGVDGLFSDFADAAFASRAMFLLSTDPDYAACLVGTSACKKGNN